MAASEDLSRDVAPEKFRSKAKSVGGFVFGSEPQASVAQLLGFSQSLLLRLLVFPQGTKSAPEHARKNRPGPVPRFFFCVF